MARRRLGADRTLSDSVDRLIADLQRVRPDLAILPLAIISRLERIRGYIDAELERVFAEHQLSGADFAVLVALARLNEPGGVPQRQLMDELGLTSGTVSVRMDRLVEHGLVERIPDADDKRNTRISLTGQGRAVFERVAPAHLANERRLLVSLSEAERDALADLLRKLLLEYEGSCASLGAARLGVTLASAHKTIAMREAVGLPPKAGLLVRAVDAAGPAARAGLRPGDVLMRARSRELRSVADLYSAIETATKRGKLRVAVLHGNEERLATLEFDAAAPASIPAATPAATAAATSAATPTATPATAPTAPPAVTAAATPTATPAAAPAASPSAPPVATPAATLAGTQAATPAAFPAASPGASPSALPVAPPAATPAATRGAPPAAYAAADALTRRPARDEHTL